MHGRDSSKNLNAYFFISCFKNWKQSVVVMGLHVNMLMEFIDWPTIINYFIIYINRFHYEISILYATVLIFVPAYHF